MNKKEQEQMKQTALFVLREYCTSIESNDYIVSEVKIERGYSLECINGVSIEPRLTGTDKISFVVNKNKK